MTCRSRKGRAERGGCERDERKKNLATLQFIARETVARGLDFQLGLWTHAYQWTDNGLAPHHGPTPDTHAPYCRDAPAMILKACPEISAHPWRKRHPGGQLSLLADIVRRHSRRRGRRIEIDMHAKGLDPKP